MKFVNCMDTKIWIVELPPILVAYYSDTKSALRLDRVLNREDHASGCEKEDDNNQDRNHCPGDLNLSTTLDCGGSTVSSLPCWRYRRITYASTPPTVRNIPGVIAKTKNESAKIECAGVDGGAKTVGLANGPCATAPCQAVIAATSRKPGLLADSSHCGNLATIGLHPSPPRQKAINRGKEKTWEPSALNKRGQRDGSS